MTNISIDSVTGSSMSGSVDLVNGIGMVRFGSDANTNVMFYMKSVLDQKKSRDQSRPIFVSKEYVRITHPGEGNLSAIDRPVEDDLSVTRRWPMQYQKFLNSQEQDMEGTPTEILFPSQPEIPANLHTQGIHTVEQLATLTGPALQNIGMGAVEWQEKARKFLDSSKGGQEYHKMAREVDELKNRNEVLQNQISLMQAQLQRLTALQQQGINPLMVPADRPTVAQAYNSTVFENQNPFNNTVPSTQEEEHPSLFSEKPIKSRRKG